MEISSCLSGSRQDVLFGDFCLTNSLCPDTPITAPELFEESRRIYFVISVYDDFCLCRVELLALGECKVPPREDRNSSDFGRGETAEKDVVAYGAGCA